MDINFRRKVYKNGTGYRGLSIPPIVSSIWGTASTVVMTLKDDGSLVIRPAQKVTKE